MIERHSMSNRLSVDDARTLLRRVYGEEGELTRLAGELDDNFLVEAPTGRSILKVMSPARGVAEVEPQVAALAHLAERAFDGAPRVIRTSTGRHSAEIEDGPAAGRAVWRLTWLEGVLLADAAPTPATLRALGRRLAELDVVLGELTCRAVPDTHLWDPARPEWVRDRLNALGDGPRRAVVERVLDEVADRLVPRRGLLRTAVIHADANDHNVVVDPSDTSTISGIFDFGDMQETARVCEPAIAAAYGAMHTEDPVAGIIATFAGYHEVTPLEAVEIEVAWALVRARLAISVTLSAERAVARPDDPYVTVSEDGAWRVLEALDACAPAELDERLASACPTPAPSGPAADLLARRAARMGSNLSLSYAEPIHAVRGWMQYLYDDTGRPFLDLYNNVPHVGHSHPHVADAIARQSARLATNTRYLSEARQDYLDRLAALFPDPLDTVFLVNSASEANELALRIARAATGRTDVVVQEGAYHGHTSRLIEMSPYKADGPGGDGVPEWVHVVPIPDPYRGVHRGSDSGAAYAAEVEACFAAATAERRPPAAFFAETFPSVGGQIVPPAGYLPAAVAAAHRHGSLFVADEVQTGFGRLGRAMWGFEVLGAIPDLVVLGKPTGNGFPVGAVVTSRAIADAFDTGMEFFSTFGGNPVACAAGAAMLDVLFDDELPARAVSLGEQLVHGLRELRQRHSWMGDVRGMGLFLGVECVSDPDARHPDAARARWMVEGLRHAGILTGTDGPDHNVVKLRGPLVLTDRNAERFVEAWSTLADRDEPV